MIKPLGDRVVVQTKTAEEVSKGGIILPDTAKEKPQEGEIIAVGPGKVLDSGKTAPVDVKVGDKVIYSKYGGTEVKVDGEEYIILRQDDILAVINGK
jgi:chaperonin GroES